MYKNRYQEQMEAMLREYGPLLKRQFLELFNKTNSYQLKNVDGFCRQMCQFGNFETGWIGKEEYIAIKGSEPNIDIIRSFDVMLTFVPNVVSFERSKAPVTMRFCAGLGEHEKHISIIPVKPGEEQSASLYANDKIGDNKCEIAIFLLEDKSQIELLNIEVNAKYALIDKNGVSFYTLE